MISVFELPCRLVSLRCTLLPRRTGRRWLNCCSSTERQLRPRLRFTILFIHSFSHFYSVPSSPLLLRFAPDYSTDTVSEFHAEAHKQLQVKVLTWRLERELNPRPSG